MCTLWTYKRIYSKAGYSYIFSYYNSRLVYCRLPLKMGKITLAASFCDANKQIKIFPRVCTLIEETLQVTLDFNFTFGLLVGFYKWKAAVFLSAVTESWVSQPTRLSLCENREGSGQLGGLTDLHGERLPSSCFTGGSGRLPLESFKIRRQFDACFCSLSDRCRGFVIFFKCHLVKLAMIIGPLWQLVSSFSKLPGNLTIATTHNPSWHWSKTFFSLLILNSVKPHEIYNCSMSVMYIFNVKDKENLLDGGWFLVFWNAKMAYYYCCMMILEFESNDDQQIVIHEWNKRSKEGINNACVIE